MIAEAGAYFGLFSAAFVAATILPAQSESVLVLMILAGKYPVAALIAVASLGNILGSVINWWLGLSLERYGARRWFLASTEALESARRWYGRYGRWSLLASWVPVIGDPITVVAGVLREPLPSFLLLVTLAKTSRYIVLAMATTSFI